MTQLNFSKDVQGFNAYAPMISTNMYSATLASGSEDSITVPESNQNWIAVLSYQPGASIWVAINNTADDPAGATFSSTTSFLLPAQLKVKAGDEISCFNNNATSQDVGIALYAIP